MATETTMHPVRSPADRASVTGGEPSPRRIGRWATTALRDLVYDGAVCMWSIVAFTVLVTGVSVTLSLILFVIGVFVWIGFAYAMRWTTWVDRRLAGWQRHERVPAAYREPSEPGFLPLLKTITSDPQTWKDLGWLALTSILGFTLGLVAITAAGLVLAYVTMPIWYWALTDPEGEYGLANLGLFTVDSLGEALAVTAIGLALIPLVLLLARGCATVHSALASRILGASPGAR